MCGPDVIALERQWQHENAAITHSCRKATSRIVSLARASRFRAASDLRESGAHPVAEPEGPLINARRPQERSRTGYGFSRIQSLYCCSRSAKTRFWASETTAPGRRSRTPRSRRTRWVALSRCRRRQRHSTHRRPLRHHQYDDLARRRTLCHCGHPRQRTLCLRLRSRGRTPGQSPGARNDRPAVPTGRRGTAPGTSTMPASRAERRLQG